MATPTNLPASFVSGEILTAANMNLLRGGFRVLQVVAGSTNTETLNSTSTYAATGLTASITPQFTTSKILVLATIAGAGKDTGDTALQLQLMRGATVIAQMENRAGFTNTVTANFIGSCSAYILDAPATTSSTTYSVNFASLSNIARVIVQQGASRSTIALLEISA
jgi:hypothetical protein